MNQQEQQGCAQRGDRKVPWFVVRPRDQMTYELGAQGPQVPGGGDIWIPGTGHPAAPERPMPEVPSAPPRREIPEPSHDPPTRSPDGPDRERAING